MRSAASALLAALLLAGIAHAAPFAGRVVAATLGPLGGGGRPDAVLGPPHGAGAFQGGTDTLSLGLFGRIVVALDDALAVDGAGADLVVFENAFLIRGATTLAPFAEPAWVSASADGVHWRTFPCAIDVPPYYPGCAGVYPVFATDAASALTPSTTPIEALIGVPVDGFLPPPGSGGDAFDLAAVGLHAARFVRIQGGGERWGLDGLGGFDLDAVAAVHAGATADAPDADGDGVPDAVDDCPAVPDPAQADGDGDGVGDACDPDGALPDADGDGVPDLLDVCPATPDAGQEDADADGAGDACDRCPGAADPAPTAACPAVPSDADFDGVPDDADPCPDDPACRPFAEGVWPGGGPRREDDALLTWDVLEERRPRVAAGVDRITVFVAIAPDVDPATIRIRLGRRDVTPTLGPFASGTTRALSLALRRRRTRVVMKARRAGARGRRARDVDRFVIRKERP
jgi:hypothetical protein